MVFGFFINLSGILSSFTAPFSVAASAGVSIASARAQKAAAARAMRAAMPEVVESEPHIPRVKRRHPK